MKMLTEWFVMMFLSIIFFTYMLFFINFMVIHQAALQLEEYAIMLIEHQNGYSEEIASELARHHNDSLSLRVVGNDNGESISYIVYVTYHAPLPFISKTLNHTVYGMSKT